MTIDIWSDVVCPWCYLGKRRLESVLADFAHRDQVEIRWRSFELDPNSPEQSTEPIELLLARKYGTSVDQVRAQNRRLTDMAAAEGLSYKLENLRQANSFAAHRLLHAAKAAGGPDLQAQVKERIMKGYFCEEAAVGRADVLRALATEAGMVTTLVDEVLAGDAYAVEVREDLSAARDIGVSGVPFFLFEGKWAVSGAQSTETFKQALKQVYEQGGTS